MLAQHPSCSPLGILHRKTFSLFEDCELLSQSKTTLDRCQVSPLVLGAIDVTVRRVVVLLMKKIIDKGRPVQDIQTVVPSRQPKETMPYPKLLVSNCLQHNRSVSILVGELSLPSNGTISPLVMHAIKKCKHSWKPPLFINRQISLHICCRRLLQVLRLKQILNCSGKSIEGFPCSAFGQTTIFISGVCSNSLCKLSKCSSDFL